MLIVFIATSLKSRTILGDMQMVLMVVVPLAIYYFLMLSTSNYLGKKYLDYGNSVALTYGTTMRNLTIAMALTITSLDGGLAVFLIAVGYLLQVPFAAIYIKYLNWRTETVPEGLIEGLSEE